MIVDCFVGLLYFISILATFYPIMDDGQIPTRISKVMQNINKNLVDITEFFERPLLYK